MDANTILAATDFGPGSMTKSGYARIVKDWKRGTPLVDAPTVYEAQTSDVSAYATVDRATDFFNTEAFLLQGTAQAS